MTTMGWQDSLFGEVDGGVDGGNDGGNDGKARELIGDCALMSFTTRSRTELGQGAWVEHHPNWLRGNLFELLHDKVPWHEERREMYHHTVAVPRLLHTYYADDPLPHPVLDRARSALSTNFSADLPEGFATAGMCLYRNGSDSVAWHGDTIGRGRTEDTLVAIVSLGAARPLLLRERGGGRSRRITLSNGDLFVMGGSCQRTFEHAVPKVTGTGPRISVQFRPLGVF